MSTDLPIKRLLIIEDEPSLLRALERGLTATAAEIRSCSTVADALKELDAARPDVVILDVGLPDGNAFDVLRAIHAARPTPHVLVISGTARQMDAFQLAQLGVRAYLQKPVTLEAVEQSLRTMLTTSQDLGAVLRAQVGQVPIHEMEEQVRKEMVDEALARTGGSRSAAARLLAISRQLLQHILRGK